MKIALLADIHANADAMSAVMAAAGSSGAEYFIVAGDLVGYYYAPDQVLALMEGRKCVMVRGNHEGLLAEWRAGQNRDAIRTRYGSGLEAVMDTLTSRAIDELTKLPDRVELKMDGRSVLVCHGSPWDPNAYVYPDAPLEVWLRMAAGMHDLVVFGHTHFPMIRDQGGTKIVNPGSVGQPRNRKPGASWALWDSATNQIELRCEAYETDRLIAECRRRDPHLPYLADVLNRT